VDNIVIDLPGDVVLLGLFIAMVAIILVSLLSWRLIVPIILTLGIIETHMSVNPRILLYDYNVLPIDVLMLGTLCAYVIRLFILRSIGITHLCWLGLALLMALALMRGVGTYGLNTAVVSFRQEFYFITSALYLQSFRWEAHDVDHFVSMWLVFAGMLLVYAIFCWVDPSFRLVLDTSISSYFGSYAYLGWRVLSASSTLLIAQAGVIAGLLWLRKERGGVLHLAAIPLFLAVALLYHRSVWMASIAAILALIVYQPKLAGRLSLPLLALGCGLVVMVALGGSDVSGAIQSAVSEPFAESSTWGWRVNNWQNMIPETFAAGTLTTLLGWGYGASFQDIITGDVLANPHNAYVLIFLNMGLSGLALFAICCVLPLWRLWQGDFPASRYFDRHTSIALGVMMIVYYVPYSVSFDHGLILGLLAALGAQATAAMGHSRSDETETAAIAGVAR
jgi:O-antigen ligase